MHTELPRGQRMQTIWMITSAPIATRSRPPYQDDLKVFKTNPFKERQRQLFWGQVKTGSLAEALETWNVM